MRYAALLATLALVGCGGHRTASGCPGARLVAVQGPLVSEATGQHTLLVEIRDRGAACVVDGVPKVEFRDAGGRTLDFTYKSTGDQMIPAAQPDPVRIAQGKPGFVEVNKYRCDIAATDSATTALLTLPRLRPLTLAVEARRSIDWCPAEKPSSIVDVSAVYAAPPPASLIHPGETRAAVVRLLGAPTRAGARCLVWRWPPEPDSALDGVRVCFRSGRVTRVQTSLHL